MSQASSSSSSAINAPGGSVNQNSPTLWLVVIVAVAIVAVVWLKKK